MGRKRIIRVAKVVPCAKCEELAKASIGTNNTTPDVTRCTTPDIADSQSPMTISAQNPIPLPKCDDCLRLAAEEQAMAATLAVEPPPPTYFYFSTSDTNSMFSVQTTVLPLVKVFQETYKNNMDSSDKTAMILDPQMIQCGNMTVVNTTEMIGFIHKYLVNWTDNVAGADYISGKVATSIKEHVLKPNDIEIIESFIKLRMGKYCDEPLDSLTLNKYIRVVTAILSELIIQATCLKIQSLVKKIYAYIACLIYDTSYSDYHEWSGEI